MEQDSRSPGPTRSDRQRERTRRRLLDAGRTLIADRGVAGLRIQEITERADVALGSFYNHFGSKEELVEQVVTESLADLATATVATVGPDADPAEAVAAANLWFIRLAYDEPDFARLVVNLGHADTLFGAAVHPYARQAVERGLAGGRFTVANLEVTLTAVIGGALALIREILDGRHEPGAELAFARHVLASLGVDPKEAAAVCESVAARTAG
ncbi:MAG TPA: TetR/AcrR family transcriptional regulator [Pseudonocardia sp.]|nr:TetR/AcrR family transcriptional regulator [Pseudonocardia sp.]